MNNAVTHPEPVPNAYHRKIELQSPLDLSYLQQNLSTAAIRKLDLHFPPSASQPATVIPLGDTSNASSQQQSNASTEDPLRARVRHLVDTFIQRTWSGAVQNIAVNGMDASSLPSLRTNNNNDDDVPSKDLEGVHFTYAPYDNRLQQRVASLYGELESLTAQVSKLRREAPKNGADMYQSAMNHRMKEEDDEFEQEIKAEEVEDALNLASLREGWQDDVQGVYARGLEELRRLGSSTGSAYDKAGGISLTETIGKAQRARNVAMELE